MNPKTQEYLKLFLGVPAAFMAMLAVFKVVAGFFGFEVFGIGRKFDQHVTYSQGYHRAVDSSLRHSEVHDEEAQELLEGVAIGECLENPCVNLARQKLLPTCYRLRITRCRQWQDSSP